MPITFLNISLALNSDLPLDELCEKVKADLEYCYEAEQGTIFHVNWDREQALAALKATVTPVQRLGKLDMPEHSKDVTQVIAFYNLTIPRPKRGEPEWRTCSVVGEDRGLPSLRGKVVLTNGIKAILIIGIDGEHHWADIHWDNFIPDDLNSIPENVKIPQPRERKVKLEKGFEEFIA